MARSAGVLEVDADGVVIWADGEARRLLGDDLQGRNVDDLGPPGHETLRAQFAQSPSARTMVGRMIRARRTDGDTVQVHIGLLPISRGRVAVAVSHSEAAIRDFRLSDVLESTATRLDMLAAEIGH